jgi:DNA-binding winged helix-turn-helix (wHTH) protein
LRYLVARSWTVCSAAEIAEVACGDSTEAGQQAVRAIVRRVRKKLEGAVGPGAGPSVKTEPRRGYMLIADVEAFTIQESAEES